MHGARQARRKRPLAAFRASQALACFLQVQNQAPTLAQVTKQDKPASREPGQPACEQPIRPLLILPTSGISSSAQVMQRTAPAAHLPGTRGLWMSPSRAAHES